MGCDTGSRTSCKRGHVGVKVIIVGGGAENYVWALKNIFKEKD